MLAQLRLGGQDGPPLRLYWGALSSEGIYLKDELNLLAEAYPRFSWVGCAEAGASEDSDLRDGRVSDAVLSDIAEARLSLNGWQVLMGGGPGMVWGTVEALLPAGLRQAQCQADAFSYAPRSVAWPDAP